MLKSKQLVFQTPITFDQKQSVTSHNVCRFDEISQQYVLISKQEVMNTVKYNNPTN